MFGIQSPSSLNDGDCGYNHLKCLSVAGMTSEFDLPNTLMQRARCVNELATCSITLDRRRAHSDVFRVLSC